MDTEYKETSATPEASVAEAAPEALKKKIPVWKWLLPVLLVLAAAAAVAFLLIGREPVAGPDDYIAELNYANGGLVTYDSEHVYYLAPSDTSLFIQKDKSTCLYEADPNGKKSRMICKKDSIVTIRSAGSELYCLGKDSSDDAPYLACIDKTSGKLTTLRRFSSETNISYFLVRDSDLFYCADGTLYKGVLESVEPSMDAVLLENCRALHFSGGTVYYSSEDEIFAYKLRSGKSRSICSMAAEQICRKGDRLFFINPDGVFSVSYKGGKPTKLATHNSSEYTVSFFTLYDGNILYAYGFGADEVDEFSPYVKRFSSNPLFLAFSKTILLLNGNAEYIGEDGGKPAGVGRPVCDLVDLPGVSSSGTASGFYITPNQTFYSRNLLFYSLVKTMEFK